MIEYVPPCIDQSKMIIACCSQRRPSCVFYLSAPLKRSTHKLSIYTASISLSFFNLSFSPSTSEIRTINPLNPSRRVMISFMTRSFSSAEATVGSAVGAVGLAHGEAESS